MNTDAKILDKNTSKSNTTICLKNIYYNQVGFISWVQGWFNTCKLISVIHHINKTKDNIYMILLIDAQNVLIGYKIHL